MYKLNQFRKKKFNGKLITAMSQNLIFGRMLKEDLSNLVVEQYALASKFLKRYVIVDCYLPKNISNPFGLPLLLINDGQDLEEMRFSTMVNQLTEANEIQPLLCIGIYAGKDRKNEYGTAKILDYQGLGAKAESYHQFILEELLPFIHLQFGIEQFSQKAFAGFSLGGLTAIDMVWNYPAIFSIAGVFSGSLWWRTKSLEDDYDDDRDRIMHQQIRKGKYHSGLRFYFTTGSLDETADRNNNGIIDSIDDTQDLIKELKKKGYASEYETKYINYEDGRHDVQTWGRAMPGFLLWGWSAKTLSKIS
jgi:enterochelin esterase-like enzyme